MKEQNFAKKLSLIEFKAMVEYEDCSTQVTPHTRKMLDEMVKKEMERKNDKENKKSI